MNCLGTLYLETKRIYLRRIEISDYQQMYYKWANLDECSKYFPWQAAKNIDEYKNRVISWIDNYSDNTYYQWIIVLKETDEIIGIINLHDVDVISNVAETSYILSPKYWGNGFMTEALDCVINYAFKRLELNRIEADVFYENIGSIKVLKKCGMKHEGILREKYFKDGKYIDAIQFSIQKT